MRRGTTRTLVLVAAAFLLGVVIVSRPKVYPRLTSEVWLSGGGNPSQPQLSIIKRQQFVHAAYLRLQLENRVLKNKLRDLINVTSSLTRTIPDLESPLLLGHHQKLGLNLANDDNGVSWNPSLGGEGRGWTNEVVPHEYEVSPASLFTGAQVFPAEPSLGGRMVEKPVGLRRADLSIALNAAINALSQHHRYTKEDFIEGNFKIESSSGTEYELIFKNTSNPGSLIKVNLLRPYSPPRVTRVTLLSTERQLIHVVVPLAGRVQVFASFMKRYHRLSLLDGHVYLTVVYFGQQGRAEVQEVLDQYRSQHHRLMLLNGTFSRARALQMGAESWPSQPDVLLFFCDVDVAFSSSFLDRCRWNTIQGEQVYYPIVFSLYNPRIVYTLNSRTEPSPDLQLRISKETGFWRDFGYGMTCHYRSDFLRVRGFAERSRLGWGGEDVALYRKFLRHPYLRVLRSTDSGLFHLYHTKSCDSRVMSPAQLRACWRTRARTEASHAQLGLLAFRGDDSL